jgi:N-acetylmuramic acid 6-phosphate etherase
MAGIDAAGVGAAGALTAPDAAAELAERLCGSLTAGSVAVASDATAAHAGALGGEPGVVLAVGTGVVALAVGPDGAMHRADGWGPWLGDTGGGGWLGQQGLRAALRAADGSGPATSLQAAAIAQFGPIPNLVALITGDPAPARLLAEFAPAVAQAARDGDPVATSLLQEAAAALAATTCAAARALGASAPTRFAMVGGLAALGEVLARPLLAVLHQAMPSLDRVWARGTALDGARFLALHSGSLHEPAVCRRSAKAAAPNRLDLLATEGVRPGLDDLDQRPPGDIVRLLLAAERGAQEALGRAAPQLAAAAEAIAERMLAGGRLFYLGAGTPGRLAVLDAAELAPTYSAPPGLVVALLAGGPAAMIQAAEGAEDDSSAAAAALDSHDLRPGDAVVGIAASGRTPYVVGGLRHAQSRGALAVAIVNNPGSSAAAAADIAVEILTGAEVVAGSTRMTAGTTQKIALNALSTAAMVALGKTYGARMVDVRATNEKLRRRALRMVCEITGASEADAATALVAAGNRVKPAVVALLAGIDVAEADRRLAQAGGRVRDAIAS